MCFFSIDAISLLYFYKDLVFIRNANLYRLQLASFIWATTECFGASKWNRTTRESSNILILTSWIYIRYFEEIFFKTFKVFKYVLMFLQPIKTCSYKKHTCSFWLVFKICWKVIFTHTHSYSKWNENDVIREKGRNDAIITLYGRCQNVTSLLLGFLLIGKFRIIFVHHLTIWFKWAFCQVLFLIREKGDSTTFFLWRDNFQLIFFVWNKRWLVDWAIWAWLCAWLILN